MRSYRFVKDSSGNQMINTTVYPNPSITLGTFLRSGNVLFTGTNAVSANNGSSVKLYAPSTWNEGSSYSHLDYTTFNNTSNQLMVYAISPGEAVHDPGVVTKGLFKDIGWQLSADSGSVPERATLISPTESITDTTPTYKWNAVSGSTWYHLFVRNSSGDISKWVTAASAGCSSGSGICSITPSTALGSGSHTWWIRTWNSSGYGPWSNGKAFSVSASASGFNSQFNGSATGWNNVAGASWQVFSSSYLSAQGIARKLASTYYQPSQSIFQL
jgi:hypothetical protein